jgi:hypothetical protein
MTQHEQSAIDLLEQARNVIEGHFYTLRDEADLTGDQLFEMRIALEDICSDIRQAARHIERLESQATVPQEM